MSGKKLLEYIQALGLTNEEFAKYIDVSIDTLKNWVYRKNEVPRGKVDFVMNKIELHPNYTSKPNNSVIIDPNKDVNILSPISNVSVPYYDVDFAGGWNSEELFTSVRPSSIITAQEFSRSEFACNLVGQSISRRIPNRSIVGLKKVNDWQTYFPTNELYGVVMKNNLRTIKIVKRSKENKNNILLIPDPLPEHNKIEYDIEEVPIDFVSVFYQVVAWGFFEKLAM
ncbi:hypothetical protein BAS10_07460 [Elizabethkingia meningoseptica]|uniref:helix-turn-helix domain-containing protein n=1 Tax=Elizabethkingia meningoseptica TaxID=238 RepID=UPI00099949E7|nr:hypothetical protein [Elizabethkingia meningoseptica]OPB96878.1 hypothetical protein BAS10_07460 [Elizabethkingia meningoseptica]